jgi:hypothetical protein
VLAAVAVGAGADVSGICSRLSSVSSSLEGVMTSSDSAARDFSTGSTGAGSGVGTSGSIVGSSLGSSIFVGSTDLGESQQVSHICTSVILLNSLRGLLWLWCRCKHAGPALLDAIWYNTGCSIRSSCSGRCGNYLGVELAKVR